MGLRGRGAVVHNRALPARARPNATTIAARAVAGEITEGSAGYWDLVIGERPGHPSPWPSPRSPARRKAWLAWRDRIKHRWPFGWSHGLRPAAWWTFEAPRLHRRLTDEQLGNVRHMSGLELVYFLDAGPAERADIEDEWRCDLVSARDRYPGNAVARRRHAIADLEVPAWFYGKETRR